MTGGGDDIAVIMEPRERGAAVDLPAEKELEDQRITQPPPGPMHNHARRAWTHTESQRKLFGREAEVDHEPYRGGVAAREPGDRPSNEDG